MKKKVDQSLFWRIVFWSVGFDVYDLNKDHSVSFKKKKSDSTWHSDGTPIPHEESLMRIIQTENNKLTQRKKKVNILERNF